MTRKNSVFDADAISLNKLFLINSGSGGFRIPIYQRQYDWDKENIARFFDDILAGLYYKIGDPSSLTFMGTIIILPEVTNEKDWSGKSFSVIDGQQRLTTCSIIASILHQEINKVIQNQTTEDDELQNWIIREAREHLNRLSQLIYGKVVLFGDKTFPFPRVIRHNDHRAENSNDSEFASSVGHYLFSHGLHIHESPTFPYADFNLQKHIKGDGKEILERNISYIIEYISEIQDPAEHDLFKLLSLKDFEKKNLKSVFLKLDNEDPNLPQKFKEGDKNLLAFLRLSSLSAYFLNNVIITQVEAKEEKYAFDIFDSLNTTGEPLTAIQTFKPIVIKSVGEEKYLGSETEEHFSVIEDFIDKFNSTYKKQAKSKDIIIPFGLYLVGEKLSRNLYQQRRFLKKRYEGLKDDKYKLKFIKSFANVVKFIDQFWSKDKPVPQLVGYPDRDHVQVCLKLLYEMDKTLTIPILARYYFKALEINDKRLFSDVVKALTSFTVLRRAITGNTAGIDSIYRGLMNQGGPKNDDENKPLKTGINGSNTLPSVEEFKIYLREWLKKGKYGISDKSEWLNRSIHVGLYQESKELCKFLLLAAFHNSRPDDSDNTILKKVKKSMELDYLRLKMWKSEPLSTVEHIAPQDGQNGWQDEIYYNNYTIHTIGNLTLLPKLENSSAGNKSWSYKYFLFQACNSKNDKELNEIISTAKTQGINFSKKLKKSLTKGEHMPYLDSIIAVENWNKDHIEKRSLNIMELVWEEVSPWLFDDK